MQLLKTSMTSVLDYSQPNAITWTNFGPNSIAYREVYCLWWKVKVIKLEGLALFIHSSRKMLPDFNLRVHSLPAHVKCDEVKIWVFLNCRKQFTVLTVLFLYSLKTKKKDELMNYLIRANLFVCLDNFICNSFGIQF